MEIPEDHVEYHSEPLETVNYGSTYLILNLGTLYLIFLILCVEAVLLFLLKPLFWVNKRARDYGNKMRQALYWNSFLRLILEASLDISITTLNNIHIYWLA